MVNKPSETKLNRSGTRQIGPSLKVCQAQEPIKLRGRLHGYSLTERLELGSDIAYEPRLRCGGEVVSAEVLVVAVT